MPVEIIPISNLVYSTERPVAYGITKDLMRYMGVPGNVRVRYYGTDAKASQWNSRILPDGTGGVLWGSTENVQIEVDEDTYMDDFWAIGAKSQEHDPIFNDPSIKFIMRPVKDTQQVVIKFTYTTSDENKANRWRNAMRVKIASHGETLVHDLIYHYEVPKSLLGLVEHIHSLKENIAGTGISLLEYIKNHFTSKLTEITTQTGTSSTLVIPETQIGVVGVFEDFEGTPAKPEKPGDQDTHTVTVSYKLIYSKPKGVMCAYPLLVHQQLIDEKYRIADAVYDLEGRLVSRSASGAGMYAFSQNIIDSNNGDRDILRIPEFDDALLKRTIPGLAMVFSGLVSLDIATPFKFFDLNDLGEYMFNKCVFDYMTLTQPLLTTLGGSMIFIGLYMNGELQPSTSIYVDKDMCVYFRNKPDFTAVYHITISVLVDTYKYNSRALIALKTHKCFPYFVSMITRILNSKGTEPLIGKVKLNDSDLVAFGIAPKGGSYGGPFRPNNQGRLAASGSRDPNTGSMSSIFIRQGVSSVIALRNAN